MVPGSLDKKSRPARAWGLPADCRRIVCKGASSDAGNLQHIPTSGCWTVKWDLTLAPDSQCSLDLGPRAQPHSHPTAGWSLVAPGHLSNLAVGCVKCRSRGLEVRASSGACGPAGVPDSSSPCRPWVRPLPQIILTLPLAFFPPPS